MSQGSLFDSVQDQLFTPAARPERAPSPVGPSLEEQTVAAQEVHDVWAARLEPVCTVPDEPRVRRSTRERREARAERLRTWADGQERKGEARVAKARAVADMIPLGQPMMPGHHSYRGDVNRRARMRSDYDKGFEALGKAESMRSRAANIEAAAARAIYSDDDNAIEALEQRIAGLEAERTMVKAYNASCRKGAPSPELLDESWLEHLEVLKRVAGWQVKNGAIPTYALSNLSGNIKRNRDRLERRWVRRCCHGSREPS